MSKIANSDTISIHIHIYYVYGWWLQNETLPMPMTSGGPAPYADVTDAPY